MRQQAEKFLAAGVAAIGGETEKALQEYQRAGIDAIAGDVLEIEIPASRAVSVTSEGNRHAPGIESLVAGAASPGTQLNSRGKEVADASAMRTETFLTSALGTDHFADGSSNWAGEA